MSEHTSGTPGGAKLRALRERAGKTQLWVEAEAELGTGYLQRVESGRVAQPERPTVERILDALGARYTERRATLEQFGYVVATPPPTEDEIAGARDAAHRELDEVAFPAYVLDCMHRLVAWNAYLPRLLGPTGDAPCLHGDDTDLPRLRRSQAAIRGDAGARRVGVVDQRPSGPDTGDPRLQDLEGRSMLAPWFDPASPLGALVVEPDRFLPALIRALRYEMQRYRAEDWYARMLAELFEALPLFRRYWEQVAREPPSASAARALVPVRLAPPGAGTLLFRLSSEPFVRDARFRVIYYFPADPATMRWCAAWAADADRQHAATRSD